MDTVKDYRHYQARRARQTQRAVQDARDAIRHRDFSLAAQDTHMKYERAHFAVVTASAAFRAGYDGIAWGTR